MTRERLLTRDLLLLLAGFFAIFANTTMLVPVIPTVVARTGGASGAGLATACFYFPAVATQFRVPQALRRFGARRLLVLAFLLLGVPCFAYLLGAKGETAILVASVFRGVGFGIATVGTGTLIAELAPDDRRGTVMGWAGLAAGIPPVFAPAAGVFLERSLGAGSAFLAAGLFGLAGAAVSAVTPDRHTSRPRPEGLLRSLATIRFGWPFAWFFLVSLCRGAALSFVPLWLIHGGLSSSEAFLLLFGTMAYVVRWLGGRWSDRVGLRRLLVPGAVMSLFGLVLLASGQGPALVVVGAGLLFGSGYGLLATTSQMDMLSRAGPGGFALPTTLWNIAIDCGVGLGGVVLGTIASASGYGVAFWVLPGALGVALLLILFEPRVSR
jgi:predicted MFS family arabinose efflux permease